jgi:hypothetical protein
VNKKNILFFPVFSEYATAIIQVKDGESLKFEVDPVGFSDRLKVDKKRKETVTDNL